MTIFFFSFAFQHNLQHVLQDCDQQYEPVLLLILRGYEEDQWYGPFVLLPVGHLQLPEIILKLYSFSHTQTNKTACDKSYLTSFYYQ